jgi:hypothetical protein
VGNKDKQQRSIPTTQQNFGYLHIIFLKGLTMSIHARKLVLIEEFLKIQDVSIIEELESVMNKERIIPVIDNFKPMSLTAFQEMIDRAKADSDAGRVITHQALKIKVKTWQ